MIFGSFGLLVVAVILLIAAVVKSSVALGVGSLICTLLATGLLMAANAYYKKLTQDAERPGGEGGDSKLRRLATTGGATTAAPSGAVVQGNGHIVTTAGAAPVIVAARPATVPNGYELLNATQAAALADTLNLDELHEVRRFEAEHEGRQTVLGAIDRRIKAIVAVRKQVAATEG